MGREVTQFVNTVQDAGYRSVQSDATNMHGKPVRARSIPLPDACW